MSGGGKNKDPKMQEIVATPPEYLKNTTPSQMPAFMPGQQEALAAQLSAGFGQQPAAFMEHLAKIYAPSNTLKFGAAPAVAPAAAAAAANVVAKAAPAKPKSSATNRTGYMTSGYNDQPGFFVRGGSGQNAR